tara:strand:- start:527 stop:1774 length:1248 start_codon:yes stop_codon:yes gene_type:complete
MLWVGGFHSYGFSAFFKPIAKELGMSRAVASTAHSITRLEGALEGPVTGWATDKFGPRSIILLGIFLWGLAMVLMYYIKSLWAFLIVWGVLLGTAWNIHQTIPLDTAITNWFVKKRGTAVGTKFVISAFSGVLVAFVAWLIINLDWRMACVIGGIAYWLAGLPLAWFFIKPRRPEYYGLLPDGATMTEEATDTTQLIESGIKYAAEVEEVEFTLRQTMRTPAYWLLIAAQSVHGLVMGTISVHLIPYLTDIGIAPLRAASMMGIMIFASTPMRFASGFITDRLKINQMRFFIGGSYLLQAIGFAVFLLNPENIFILYAGLILYGMGTAASFMFNVMVGRYYGRKAFGSIRGVSMTLATPVGVAAPIYAGWVYDTTGSYITAFSVFALLLPLSAVLIFLARPPKPPARITAVRKFL